MEGRKDRNQDQADDSRVETRLEFRGKGGDGRVCQRTDGSGGEVMRYREWAVVVYVEVADVDVAERWAQS